MNKKIFVIPRHTEVCKCCDAIVDVAVVSEGTYAKCPRCGKTITKLISQPIIKPLAYSLSTIILMIFAALLPFISIKFGTIVCSMSIFDTVTVMYEEEFQALAIVIMLFILLIPFICINLIFIIYFCLYYHIANSKILKRLAKIHFKLYHWSMVDVFLAAVMVSLVKIIAYADVHLDTGFICFIAYSVCYVKTMLSIDRGWLWSIILESNKELSKIEITNETAFGNENHIANCSCCDNIVDLRTKECPFCQTKIKPIDYKCVEKCMAFLIAAIIFYIPANLFPIMITEALGSLEESTIIGGAILLWNTGSQPIAIVIFIASVFIPLFKIIVLLSLCWSIKHSSDKNIAQKSKLYAVTEFIGKWSMIDVFVVAVLCSLLRIQNLMAIYPSTAAICFCTVVILTMLAADSLDPRLIWRKHPLNYKED